MDSFSSGFNFHLPNDFTALSSVISPVVMLGISLFGPPFVVNIMVNILAKFLKGEPEATNEGIEEYRFWPIW